MLVTWVHSGDVVLCKSDGSFSASVLRGMHNNEITSDVSLMGAPAVGVDLNTLVPISAHRAVLAQVSKYFHKLFFVDKTSKTTFSIPTVGHDILRYVIEYIYTDKFDLKANEVGDRVRGILNAAKFFRMDRLAEACELFLSREAPITLDNCIDMWRLARKYDSLDRLQVACLFIAQNLALLLKDEKFLSMTQEECSKLLLSESVVTDATADHRCRAAIAWLKYDCVARADCVEDILNMVPLNKDAALSDETLIEAGTIHMALPKAAVRLMEAYVGTVKKFKRDRELIVPKVEEVACSITPLPATASTTKRMSDAWYIIGGSKSELLVYDVVKRFWSSSDLPWKRNVAGACGLGKRVIVMGGTKNGTLSADIDEYDVQHKAWITSTCKLSVARKSLAVCADQQFAYALGGHGMQTLAEKYRAGPDRNIRQIASMNVERYNAASVLYSSHAGEAVYVAGGCGGPVASRLQSIDKYDCSANKWSRHGEMKVARSMLGAALLGDDLYLAGGYDGAKGIADVEIFNIRTGQFREGPELLIGRAGCGAVSLDNNVLCVIGGKTTKIVTNTVEAFDSREGKWSVGVIVPHMPTPNSFFALATV